MGQKPEFDGVKLSLMHLDFSTGSFLGEPPQSVKTLGELASLFRDRMMAERMDASTVVYEIHGCPAEAEGRPRLLYATTVLHPGIVSGEFFMTRGHFHTNPERGEFMMTCEGEGVLLLMDRERNTWSERMEKGSVHDIDGRYAHRVVNTGSESLVFLVVWMSDCGHEYDSIMESGFGKAVVAEGGRFALVPR
jgi:glucose-6-phosphate isomerase